MIKTNTILPEYFTEHVIETSDLPKQIQDMDHLLEKHKRHAMSFEINQMPFAVLLEHTARVKQAKDAFSIHSAHPSHFKHVMHEGSVVPVRHFGNYETCENILILLNNNQLLGLFCNNTQIMKEYILWDDEFQNWTLQKPQRLYFLFQGSHAASIEK